MSNFDAIRAKYKPFTRPVTLWLDGEADARIRELVGELNALDVGDSLDGNPQRVAIEDELEALYERARDSEQQFVFQSVPENMWMRLLAECPPREEDTALGFDFDDSTFPAKLMAACLIEPKLTEHDVTQLRGILNTGQWRILWNTLQAANIGTAEGNIPKSARRGNATLPSGHAPKQPTPTESPTASS